MKKWGKLTALLIAVIMMLCACDFTTTNNTTGQLVISGELHWAATSADVFIDGTKVGTFTGEPLKLSVAVGTHKLELKSYSGDNPKPAYTYSHDIEITTLKETKIKLYPHDWNDSTETGSFSYDCPEYPGADMYDIKFSGRKYGLGGIGSSSLKSYRPKNMKPGTYEVEVYAYKDGKLTATATPAALVIEEGKSVEYTFPVEDWKEFTGPSQKVKATLEAEATQESDSVILFLNDEYVCKENESKEYMLDNSLIYSVELFGFKNGNPIEYEEYNIKPHREMWYSFRPYEKWCNLAINTIPYEGATSYAYTLDGKPFYDSLNYIHLLPGDHHFEIHALNDSGCIASKYFDFNLNNHENKEITVDVWEKPLDEATITSVVESFNTASWGFNRAYNYPLNRLTKELVSVLEGALNENIETLLGEAQKINDIKCTVENGTFTATLKFKLKDTTTTMTVEQSPFGALRITRVNKMDNGTTYTDHMSYALLDEYRFKYAKNISDNITFVDNITWEGNNQTETIVAAKIRDKAELSKLLQVNGFEPTGADWDAYNKKYVKETSEGNYNIWITRKHPDGSYSVSIREFNR